MVTTDGATAPPQGLPLPRLLARLDTERLRRYREHLDFYRGLQWRGTAHRWERRLTFNYARVLVEKVTSYLVQGLAVALEPVDPTSEGYRRAREAEQALQEVAEASALEQLDFDTELDAAVLGDGCYKVVWDEEEGRVRVTAPDVQGLFAWWVPDDPQRVWRVAARYRLPAEEAAHLYGVRPRQRGEVTVVEGWTADTLELWVEEELADRRPNPYGFIPFVIFPNLREPKQFWGVSDLPALMEPSRELNRALSQLSMILELSGNPIAVLEGVEEARDIAVQPGAVWELPERARAYLLDLLQGIAFGDNPRSLSGVAREMELHPLLQRVRRKRLIRTAVYRRRVELALRLLEGRLGVRWGPLRVRVLWGPLLPQDRHRLVQEERLLVEAGLHSRRRAMEALGVEDPEAEEARVRAERAQG